MTDDRKCVALAQLRPSSVRPSSLHTRDATHGPLPIDTGLHFGVCALDLGGQMMLVRKACSAAGHDFGSAVRRHGDAPHAW